MSTVRRNELVTGHSDSTAVLSLSVLGASLLAFVGSWLLLFQWVDETTTLVGLTALQWLGVIMLFVSGGTAGLGLLSRYGSRTSTPSDTAGAVVGFVAGFLWACAGFLLVSRVTGTATLSLLVALLTGVVAFVATIYPREDIGTTVPISALIALLGVVVASGFFDAGFVWDPSWTVAVIPGSELVPVIVAAGAVLGTWNAAKARDGFGAGGRQAGAFYLIGTIVFGLLSVLLLLIGFIVVRGLETMLTGASLTSIPFVTNNTGGLFVEVPGVLPAIMGTLWLVFGAVVFAVPLGIGAAVFLTEYAERGRFTQVVEVATNGLWSTPSIVFGLFGLAFLVPRISGGNSIFVGQLVLGFMLLPLVLITSREAIKAVPDAHRDASVALGVTKWQTIRSVVLPAAMPGTITGVILGVGRIAGETAPLLLVFGGSPYPSTTPNVLSSFQFTAQPPYITNEALLDPASALPYQLYSTITAGVFPSEAFTNQEFGWGTALVLLIVVIGLYAIGVGSRLYFRRKLHQ